MQLTKDFSLEEMTSSDTAIRRGIKEQFTPNDSVTYNLAELCKNILQPLREYVGAKVTVTSGYRCERLNKIIGGSSTSQHMIGQAADIKIEGKTPLEVCKIIDSLNLPFDQLIEEFGIWTHVSFNVKKRRGQVLKAAKEVDGRTEYKPLILR